MKITEQEEMEKEFEKWLSTQNIDDPNQKYRNDLEREFCIGFGKGYREAASDAWKVQQEKIDELEFYKEQWQSIAGKDNLKHLVKEIESLKSDLKQMSYCVKVFLPELRGRDAIEIIKRHNLDKSEEV